MSDMAWRGERVGKITASRFPVILGLSPYMTPEQLKRLMVREMHGVFDEFENAATRHGKEHEEDALASFAEFAMFERERLKPSRFIVSRDNAWAGCTPDALVGYAIGVEVKCPLRRHVRDVVVDPMYIAQCRWSMWVTGRAHWYLYAWSDHGCACNCLNSDSHPVTDDEIQLCQSFLDEVHAVFGDRELSAPYLAPEVDVRTDSEWLAAATEYVEACQAMEDISAQIVPLKERLLKLADGQKSSGCGVTVFPTTRKSLNKKAMMAELGLDDLSKWESENQSWSIRRVKPKAVR